MTRAHFNPMTPLLSIFALTLVLTAALVLVSQGAAQASFDRKAMLENIALNVIVPCYDRFAEQAAVLDGAARRLTDAPGADSLAAAKTAWNDAAFAWAQCEPYAFGGLEAKILRNQINKTPVNPLQIEKILEDGEPRDAAFTENLGSSARGVGTLAYFLFSQDEQTVLTALQAEKRAAYLSALTADVHGKAAALVAFWSPTYRDYAVTFKAADQAGGSVKGSFNMLVNEIIGVLEQTAQTKLTTPVGEPDPAAVQHVRGNLLGAQRLFMGADGSGVDDYLTFLGAGELAESVTARFGAAVAKLDALTEAVPTTNDALKEVSRVYDDIETLLVLTSVDAANQLGVTVTFNDSDGDYSVEGQGVEGRGVES
ncbi:hypothetical protein BH24DEI2_BH24DEI2_15790 [soil metagenome]